MFSAVGEQQGPIRRPVLYPIELQVRMGFLLVELKISFSLVTVLHLNYTSGGDTGGTKTGQTIPGISVVCTRFRAVG